MHVLRCLHRFEQRAGGFVDADVSGLGGEDHGDEQLINIAIFQFRLRLWILFGQAAIEFEDVRFFHRVRARARSSCRSARQRSEEHTSELQSLMRTPYAVFCLKKKKNKQYTIKANEQTQTIRKPSRTHQK